MTLQDRIQSLQRLAAHLDGPEDEFLTALMKRTAVNNPWLTVENQQRALVAIREQFLDAGKLREWLASYLPSDTAPARRRPQDLLAVGLVLAGNIPLVGFHDVLCVYLAGHRAQIKLSQKDAYVLPYLLKLLARYGPESAAYFEVVDKLSGFDAVIATGSNNSGRYFEAYFGKYPHIIRKNRTAIGVLGGDEDATELRALGRDVFAYFGLGCRNVSKLFVPRAYDFSTLLEVFHDWRDYQNFVKWKNNFDYNFALLTLNKEPFYNNGAVILRESTELASPIATLFYEPYDTAADLNAKLDAVAGSTQLIVAPEGLLERPTYRFGEAQQPALDDYADGVDTMAFLSQL